MAPARQDTPIRIWSGFSTCLLYGLYSYLYTPEELRQIIVSDPFDQAEPPRSLKLVDFAAWLEAILA